jgi:hypothetical protein
MSRLARRVVGVAALGAIGVILLLIACAFLGTASYLFLAERVGALLAALGIGAGALLLGVIAFLAIGRVLGPAKAKRQSLEGALMDALGKDHVAVWLGVIRGHGTEAAALSLLAGVAVGASPRLRRAIYVLLGL